MTVESLRIGSAARLLDANDREVAWAERAIRKDQYTKWVLGNFVEFGKPNQNGQIFRIEEAAVASQTVTGRPLNMLHRERHIVGSFADAELLNPPTIPEAAAEKTPIQPANASGEFPRVEALANMWKFIFPDEFELIERAHKEGTLYYSMETMPETAHCPPELGGCGLTVPYDGPKSSTYCEHMNKPGGNRVLEQPNFLGGAIIIPPVKPGWNEANISELAKLTDEEAHTLYTEIKTEFAHLEASAWHGLMAQIVKVHEDMQAGI